MEQSVPKSGTSKNANFADPKSLVEISPALSFFPKIK